jgi:hypothetical protein
LENFNGFSKKLSKQLEDKSKGELGVDEIRNIIKTINEFFFTNYKGIGTTEALDNIFEYFSDFHKFWETYHEKIIGPFIDEERCSKVADCLHGILQVYGDRPFKEIYNTENLTEGEICRVRYFTANQDFRESIDNPKLFKIYKKNPEIFNIQRIYEDPEFFLKSMKLYNLSQSDKRVKFAKIAAKLLIDKKIDNPIELLKYCDFDIEVIRALMINNKGSGFGKKKVDIFIRDMVVLGVWKKYKNFSVIDVASDTNTIKVALRTGILKTKIPLVSSFLDIFSHQYTLIEKYNANAWRKVWEIWKEKYPDDSEIDSPCLMDYLIYRIIGKEFCKEALYTLECQDRKHIIKWHNGRKKLCPICKEKGKISNLKIIKRDLPCVDDAGYIYFKSNKFVEGDNAVLVGLKECPFIEVCKPREKDFVKYNSPKSISILGRTGWDTARAKPEEGGGGLMA